ncbi:hypothetical protein DYB38_000298 [Aphanomyces astaci]|uniref:Mitochondrial ribonuclease P catalytic subunit n=1 Tax=Aphanomyces astaci TaxID=112090 RepID=A0A397DFT8_APHAT|nr:hypothetical protein DYB38_000298 [Aphanomyces astaci]
MKDNDIPLQTYLYQMILNICGQSTTQDDIVEAAFDVYEHMKTHASSTPRSKKHPVDESSYSALIKLCSKHHITDRALALIAELEAHKVSPKLRTFAPLLAEFASTLDLTQAWWVFEKLLEHEIDATEGEYIALLTASSALNDVSMFYKSELHKGDAWQCNIGEVNDQGICSVTGSTLQSVELSREKEDALLAKVGYVTWHSLILLLCVENLVCTSDERIEQWTVFKTWLDEHGPFDVIIDAANVGGGFNYPQIQTVLKAYQDKGQKPLIVLHKRRTKDHQVPEPYRAMVQQWKHDNVMFNCQYGNNDDWYWLYAAVKLSGRTLVVSNDEMRDHHFQMIHNQDFHRWKERHLVHYEVRGHKLDLHEPSVYSMRSQHLESGSWHFPSTASSDWLFDLVRLKWLPVVTAVNPGLRFDHVSAVRQATQEVYIYGGMTLNISAFNQVLGWNDDDGYTQQGDVWVLDTVAETWTKVQTVPQDGHGVPLARSEATAVTAADTAMVVFGGVVIPSNNSLIPVDLSDLWRLDFVTKQWTELTTVAGTAKPVARFSHAATTIPGTNAYPRTTSVLELLRGPVGTVEHMVVLSGRHIVGDGWTILTDAWMVPLSYEGSGLTWTLLHADPAYDRIYSGVVYAHQGLWMIGGFNYIGQDNAVAYPDTIYAATDAVPNLELKFDYTSDASTLTARFNHRMAVYKSGILVYGGKFQRCYGDLWLRNTTTLPTDSSPYIQDLNAISPVMFLLLAFVVLFITCIILIAHLYKRLYRQQVRGSSELLEVHILGTFRDGMPCVNCFDSLIGQWVQITPPSCIHRLPAPRTEAVAVPTGDAMVVFGGVVLPSSNESAADFNDIWQFRYDTETWREVVPKANTPLPLPRFSHTATTVTGTPLS